MSSDLVLRARAIALEALKDEVRSDQTPFIGHPDAVAAIVRDEIGLGEECIAAVYLHEATRVHKEISLDGFPQDVLVMVDGLNRISTIKPKDTRLEAENYKKLIVKYSSDPRVTVIKIADRLEIMRSLGSFPKSSREQKQLETLMLYIPLAHQLGLYNIKSELEDIYFKYADPEQYRAIKNKLAATAPEREKLSCEFIEPLQEKLTAAGIKYKMKVRTKTAYSIYRKMRAQNVPFEGVYDVFAMRFIIDCDPDPAVEKDLCWKVYSYVTQEYEPDTARLRDWLTNPKPNGYESLHITVRNRAGAYIEVQIRTRRMDEIAESGLASHWSYKGISSEKTLSSWLNSVRYALEHPSELGPDEMPPAPVDEIFVFTPTGELRILPAGASVLDFAFNIHSGLGCRCSGARIGVKAVSIRETLHTGDVVEILTTRSQTPSKDWLDFVVTGKARTKIKQELDASLRKQAAAGREVLERRLRNWKLEFTDEQQHEYVRRHKLPGILQMMAAIGDDQIDVNDIKEFILDYDNITKPDVQEPETRKAAFSGSGDDILVLSAKDVKGLQYTMAHCCNPVFGDDVFGFVTRTAGIKIHRMSCPNAARLIEHYPYRIQRVKWQQTQSSGEFLCTLNIFAEPDRNALHSIMDAASQYRVSVRSCSVSPVLKGGLEQISVQLLVPSGAELDKVMSAVGRIKSVNKVKRI
ncbi:MAG: bifunctional (p)ppGpp synthetase/guanosine-3',5'-bis(diphosphate) 3'-pyrophosphohydrolase [Bacteroidales bacterium]|nr:bifunctional (p)ppGpp synthetase/guanosine-3',5'-bis(diphosphate) 3'-pyrophosphohydrolase [Candidatus Cryptobacteroides aphodequi]